MTIQPDRIGDIARRHGLDPEAVRALADALSAGRGTGAQWHHPALGGMGQWMAGGMLQIGDMFNHDLKARVSGALADLAKEVADPRAPAEGAAPSGRRPAGAWWPAALGAPAATGAQDAMRYACFPDRRRLVVERHGRTTVYDTGGHRLTGFAQSQGGADGLAFSGPDGPVALDDLTVLA